MPSLHTETEQKQWELNYNMLRRCLLRKKK